MRIDGKAEGPRQTMSWLHTWASLILGWLLYAIFLTGTLSFFQNEITVWMKPELHQSVPAASQVKQTEVALGYLQKHAPDAASWNIQLPNARQTSTELTIRKQGEDPNSRRGGERITIDSATGEVIKARETRGGGFLYRFHFELYGFPRIWSRWFVGIATMFMLVAIISGVITHKKIFKDFFTFRPGKGQRSWLDAHNATAIFALPFHIMITFSGLLLLMFMLMPWGMKQVYPNGIDFFYEMRGQPIPKVQNKETEQGKTARQKPQSEAEPILEAASLTHIEPLMHYAQSQWKTNPIGSIQISAPNTVNASIELKAAYAKNLIERNVNPSLKFNGVNGQLDATATPVEKTSVPMGIYNVVTMLHEARGVDLALRWLLFLSGIVGTLMIATGLVLWTVKRAPQQQKQGYTSFGYRLVEATNIAAIIGLPLAVAAYFYANRFIPIEMEMRLNWEIRCFFSIWLLTLIYAALRPSRKAWLELLLFAAVSFAFLPILNALTGGAALWQSIENQQWMIATFDLMSLTLALLFLFSFYKVKHHKGLANKKGKAAAQESQL